MGELAGGTTIGGYTALHTGMREISLGAKLFLSGQIISTDGLIIERDWNNLTLRSITPGLDPELKLGSPGGEWSIRNDDSANNTMDIRWNNSSTAVFYTNGDFKVRRNLTVDGNLMYNGKELNATYVSYTDNYASYDLVGNSSYPRLKINNSGASSPNWIRVGESSGYGLLPYSNNTGSLGTSSWKFNQIHGTTIYENGTSLSSKYANTDHGHDDRYVQLNGYSGMLNITGAINFRSEMGGGSIYGWITGDGDARFQYLSVSNNLKVTGTGTNGGITTEEMMVKKRLDFGNPDACFYTEYGNPRGNVNAGYWAVVAYGGNLIASFPYSSSTSTIIEFYRDLRIVSAPGSSNTKIKGQGIFNLENETYGSMLRIGGDTTSPWLLSMDVYNRTYTYAANVYVTGNGVIGRSTSARKYKLYEKEIELEYAERILTVNPKTWFDRGTVEAYASQLSNNSPLGEEDLFIERVPGMVAEDFEDAGLQQYVIYSEPTKEGQREVEGLMYDRAWGLLIPNVRKNKERIEILEAENIGMKEEISTLKERLEKLEKMVDSLIA